MNRLSKLEQHLDVRIVVALLGTILWLVSGTCDAQSTLPAPPKIGNETFSEDDPIGYVVASIRYVIFLGLTIIVVFALIGFSSGLISEVNDARKKGEWGRFSVYFGAGLLVILIVILGAWWGSEILSDILTI